jgi:hypothetical protein
VGFSNFLRKKLPAKEGRIHYKNKRKNGASTVFQAPKNQSFSGYKVRRYLFLGGG